jgi:hypothetical protein
MNSLGYQQITSLATAVGFTLPTGAKKAVVIATDQDLRWRDDGTSPNATTGMLLKTNTVYIFEHSLQLVKFIETTTSGKLNISYYG